MKYLEGLKLSIDAGLLPCFMEDFDFGRYIPRNEYEQWLSEH